MRDVCARHAITQNLSVILKTIVLLGNYKELARMGSFWTWTVLLKFSTMCSCNSIFYKKGAYIMKKKERKKKVKIPDKGRFFGMKLMLLSRESVLTEKWNPIILTFAFTAHFLRNRLVFWNFVFHACPARENKREVVTFFGASLNHHAQSSSVNVSVALYLVNYSASKMIKSEFRYPVQEILVNVEAFAQMCSVEKLFRKSSQTSQENT